MKIATSTYIFGSIEKAVETLSDTPIRDLEAYEILAPGRDDLRQLRVHQRTYEELSQLRDSLSQKGFRIAAISGHTDLLEKDNQQRRQNIAHLERCVDAAPVLKCPIVVFASGAGTGDSDKDWNDLTESIKHLCSRAGRHDVKIAFECHYHEFISSTDDAIKLVKQVNRANFGINYDPWHFELAGEDIAESVGKCAPMIVHTHLHDVPHDSVDLPWYKRECIPGDGSINWAVIFEQLKKNNYDGVLSIELHQVYNDILSDCRKAYKFLSEKCVSL